MRVLFVYSDISGEARYGARKFYAGIGSLSAVLRAEGHETSLVYLQEELDSDEFVAQVREHEPDLLAFSATTHQYPFVRRYAEAVGEALTALPRLVGGTHATLVPDEVAATGAFDIVCVGEGEYPLRDLCERLGAGKDYGDVRNLWIVRDGDVTRNMLRPLIADLDELPYVDREVFGFREMLSANDGWVDIMAGRGCPYSCSYCCNPGLKARYRGLGRYVRQRSVEHVMGELRELHRCYAVKTINFQDDTFTLDKDWTIDFCDAYGEAFRTPFWVNTRPERLLDADIVRALSRAGCAGVRIGVENGDESLRRAVLKRTMSNEDIVRAFHLARRHGLKTYTCNMIGVPGETPETVAATIDLNRQLAPDGLQFSVFYPYPMTELYDTCVAQGLIRPGVEVTGYYGEESVLDLPTISRDELKEGYDRFKVLPAEIALKRASPLKHRVYTVLLWLYGGDGPRLQRHLDALRAVARRARER